MTIIYMLLIISLLVAILFFILFVFSVKKGQYDDTYTPAVRMLFEDELVKNPENSKAEENLKKLPNNTEKTNPDK
ncbi:MAG: cbb3-type cytochrome oxidase assembly protein CcoS [Aequorivita sp.]|nr:cbb3-type cytochrome oxidase assembly protein CcoS [Aequorivita sp.]